MNTTGDDASGLAPDDAFRAAARLHSAGRFADAEALLRGAIARHPSDSVLLNARGVMLAALGRHLDALWCYRAALAFNPRGPGLWTNLGNALTELKQFKSALVCHQRAVAESKPDALLFQNLGASLSLAGRHGEAVAAFRRAVEIKPDALMARWDLARSYLYLGNYRQAWPDYEVRIDTGQVPRRDLPGGKWDGTPYAGKRLLLVAEQGFGDTLWITRYLPHVKALGGTLVMECQLELMPLIADMGLDIQLVPRDTPLPAADFWCYHCSLPGLFTPEIAAIPAPPYLCAPRDRFAKFAPVCDRAGGKLKVGIVWSGSVTFKRNHERAQPLTRFLQAFAMPGVQLFSLQKGPPRQELTALELDVPIIDLDPLLADFADTAAAVAQLDLIIMTDSAVAHLAGALGKPVWLLLGFVAHWLWLKERADSPWYPSARLFRPRADGDWDFVFDSAAAELMALART